MGGVTTAHRWLQQSDDKVGIYNCWDTVSTAACVPYLQKELEVRGQKEFWDWWFRRLGPVVHSMWRRGCGQLDREGKRALRTAYRRELRATEQVVRAGMGDPSQYTDKFFGSTQPRGGQRAKLLYDELGLPVPPPTRKRAERSTNQEALLWILRNLRKRDEHLVPILHAFFHRSRLNTIYTRYLSVEADPDGRVRPTIKLGGTETLRFAYADPPLQQWPAEIRHIIRPRPGRVFLAADYRQLEARISAIMSSDPVDLAIFAHDPPPGSHPHDPTHDVHSSNATALFGYDKEKWLSLPDLERTKTRNFAKNWRYEVGYGGTGDTASGKTYCPCVQWGCVEKMPPTLDLKRAEIEAAGRRWGRSHRPYLQWRDQLVDRTVHNGYVYESPWGYRRQFFRPMPSVKNEIYNFPIQHAAALIIHEAEVTLHEKYEAPLVLQMHDEIMLEVPEGEVTSWSERLREVMERPIPQLDNVCLPVDIAVGDSWGAAK